MIVRERSVCRACAGSLQSIFNLGNQQIIGFGETEKEIAAPLHLMKCESCHLVQLKHTLDRDLLFKKYYYKSGVNTTMRNHLWEIVNEIQKRVKLERGDNIVDIGANDGTLLSFYDNAYSLIGFEPAMDAPTDFDIWQWRRDYFSADGYQPIAHKARVITCIATFYSIDDPNKFLADVRRVLAPDGLFALQVNYLPSMLERNGIDDVCHEHCAYYSLTSLVPLLDNNGFDIVDVELTPINGGCIRLYIKHGLSKAGGYSLNSPFGKKIIPLWEKEREMKLDTMKPYLEFKERVLENAKNLKEFIQVNGNGIPSGRQRGIVDIYGASARGATLLQLAGITEKDIRYAVDRNPEKVGKRYLGTIPVISEEQARQQVPDYYLILPHSFLGEFIDREKAYLMCSGAVGNPTRGFILPIPYPYIIEGRKI